MVIALHGRAAVSDHPDSHFVALGGGVVRSAPAILRPASYSMLEPHP